MEKKLVYFDGMQLDSQPLVYMHECYKEMNFGMPNNWVWFSVQDLLNILAMVNALNDGSKVGDGVRLYHGVYEKRVCDYLDNNPSHISYQDHLNHNTVFFMPTYKITSGPNRGEHIDNVDPTDVAKWRQSYQDGEPLPMAFSEGYDVGTICPPYTPPATSCANSGSSL